MRITTAIVGSVLLLGPVDAAQRKSIPPGIDLVEIDVAVVDRAQQPVTGLTAEDFVVRDDGAPASIKTFREVHATPGNDPDQGRSLILLLDDVAVPAEGTRAIQTIGKAFLQSVNARDDVSVVRLHNEADQPFGDRVVAESRLATFRAGAFPFADLDTVSDVFGRIGDIARQLESDDHRRKAIVCVGASVTCNAGEPARGSVWPRHWTSWVEAVSATATSNVAVYAIIPGPSTLRGGGLPDLTGGEVFATMYDVGPPIDRILRDASNYYMLGYWPSGKTRELHSVEVKVPRRGVKVYARRLRGNPPF